LLEHGIDEDDFGKVSNQKLEDKCKIIYNGSLYEGVKPLFDDTFEALKSFPKNKLQLDFYVPQIKKEYFENAIELGSMINILDAIPACEFFNEMSKANFVLIIYPEKNADFFTTKFAEIIHLKVPIVFIGKEGYVSKFLTENSLGICIQPNQIKEKLPSIISAKTMINYNVGFDISKFQYASITEALLKRVSAINNKY
jgi:hypothetical protein